MADPTARDGSDANDVQDLFTGQLGRTSRSETPMQEPGEAQSRQLAGGDGSGPDEAHREQGATAHNPAPASDAAAEPDADQDAGTETGKDVDEDGEAAGHPS